MKQRRRSPLRRVARAAELDRARVARARMRSERILLAAVRRRSSARGRILSYHGVGTPEWGVNDVTPERFREHLEFAADAGYEFVPARELANSLGDDRKLAITFDDGLRSVATKAAPILADYGIPWTLFVVTDWAEGHHPSYPDLFLRWPEIERLAASGASIGSHSRSHPDFGRLARDDAFRQLVGSRQAIRDRLGIDVHEFAIPMGRSVNWSAAAGDAARDAGYTTVYAQAEDRRPSGTVPRTFISGSDGERVFRGALAGAFDRWEEWI